MWNSLTEQQEGIDELVKATQAADAAKSAGAWGSAGAAGIGAVSQIANQLMQAKANRESENRKGFRDSASQLGKDRQKILAESAANQITPLMRLMEAYRSIRKG